MIAIMADHDCEGQLQVLLRLLTSTAWRALWMELAVHVESFASLGVSPNMPDADLWRLCQTRQIVLITGNRNEEGPTSLEATLQAANTPTSLSVLTLSEPQRVLSSRAYAQRVVERLVEYLIDGHCSKDSGLCVSPTCLM